MPFELIYYVVWAMDMPVLLDVDINKGIDKHPDFEAVEGDEDMNHYCTGYKKKLFSCENDEWEEAKLPTGVPWRDGIGTITADGAVSKGHRCRRFTNIHGIPAELASGGLGSSTDAILVVVDVRSTRHLLLFDNQIVGVDHHTNRDIRLVGSRSQSERVLRHLFTILKRVSQNVNRKRREATLGCGK